MAIDSYLGGSGTWAVELDFGFSSTRRKEPSTSRTSRSNIPARPVEYLRARRDRRDRAASRCRAARKPDAFQHPVKIGQVGFNSALVLRQHQDAIARRALLDGGNGHEDRALHS